MGVWVPECVKGLIVDIFGPEHSIYFPIKGGFEYLILKDEWEDIDIAFYQHIRDGLWVEWKLLFSDAKF